MRPCDRKWYAATALVPFIVVSVPVLVAAGQSSSQRGPFERVAVPSEDLGVLNLNSASLDELMRLPGIGPARARAVLELRAKLKRFQKLEQLMRVKGIGRKTFRKLMPLLRLTGETTLVRGRSRPCGPRAENTERGPPSPQRAQ